MQNVRNLNLNNNFVQFSGGGHAYSASAQPFKFNTKNTDSVSFSSKHKKQEEPVTFMEGTKIILKGAGNKAKDFFKTIIKHPVQTLAVIGGTSAALAALPLVGISAATGASALAVGFGAYAVFKTVKHASNAVHNNNKKDYSALRDDLKQIGGDTVDLALTVPFAPKGITNLKNAFKYAPKPAINSDLINNIKSAKGLKEKAFEFFKAELKLKYQQIGSQMGFKTIPEIEFTDTMPGALVGYFEPASGKMFLNNKFINPLYRFSLKLKNALNGQKLNTELHPEGFLRHELEHFSQFSKIVRTENIGTEGLKQAVLNYHKDRLPIIREDLPKLKAALEKLKNETQKSSQISEQINELNTEILYSENELKLSEAILNFPDRVFNTKFYNKITSQTSPIKQNSAEASEANKFLNAFYDKINAAKKIKKYEKMFNEGKITLNEFQNKFLEIYEGNELEVPAYKAQREYCNSITQGRASISDAAIMAHSNINA